MLPAVVENAVIDLVGDQDEVVTVRKGGDRLHFLGIEDAAGRVVGRIQKQSPRAGRDGGLQAVGVDAIAGGIENDGHGCGAAASRAEGPEGFVSRFQYDELVAGIEQGPAVKW